jgi:hypothetical protein
VVDLYSRCTDQWQQQQNGGYRLANADIVAAMQAMQVAPNDQRALFDEVKILTLEITALLNHDQSVKQEQARANRNGQATGRLNRRG